MMGINRTGRLMVITVLGVFVVSGCGYRFAGKGPLPTGIDTVFISVFENNSLLLGIENDFTDSLTREFVRRRPGSLVERQAADAVFYGTITSISTTTVSHRDEYTATQRRVWVRLKGQLVSPQGETLWATDNISDNAVYAVETEKYATDENLRAAVRQLADDLAERLYNQMTANF